MTPSCAFGGLDIVVNNAGISLAAAGRGHDARTVEHAIMSILGTGYFLVAREGYRLMKRQGLGGSMVFIGSKNAIAASPGASAYCTAKAAEMHLARCMALEGAPLGIRVNVVNPDAVLRGSKIWQGEWRQQRAAIEQDRRRRARGTSTASARCCSARSIPRTSPRRSISSPPTCLPNRPAISSMSTPATQSAFTR